MRDQTLPAIGVAVVGDVARADLGAPTVVAEPTAADETAALDRSPLQAALAIVASRAILMGFGVATNLIAARMLEPAGRGQLAAGLQVGYLLAIGVLLGLDKALAVAAPGEPAARAFQVGRLLMHRRALLLVTFGTTATLAGMFFEQVALASFGLFVSVIAVFNAQFRLIEAAVVNFDRAEWMSRFQFVSGAVTLLMVTGLAVTGLRQPVLWLGAYAASSVVVAEVFARTHGKATSRPNSTHERLASAWHPLGRRLVPASLASFATLRSDRLLLPMLAGTEQLGFYVVVATFVDLATLPFDSLANALVPRWRRRALAGPLAVGGTLAIAAVLAIGAAVGVWLVGSLLVVPLFGAAYSPGVELLPALSIAALLLAWSRLAQARALALGLDTVVSSAETAGLVTALTGYVTLIPMLGAEGAALGSALGYGASLVVMVLGQVRHRKVASPQPAQRVSPQPTEGTDGKPVA